MWLKIVLSVTCLLSFPSYAKEATICEGVGFYSGFFEHDPPSVSFISKKFISGDPEKCDFNAFIPDGYGDYTKTALVVNSKELEQGKFYTFKYKVVEPEFEDNLDKTIEIIQAEPSFLTIDEYANAKQGKRLDICAENEEISEYNDRYFSISRERVDCPRMAEFGQCSYNVYSRSGVLLSDYCGANDAAPAVEPFNSLVCHNFNFETLLKLPNICKKGNQVSRNFHIGVFKVEPSYKPEV